MTSNFSIEYQIREMVDRETRAWDTQDVELLMTLFHPDMVWPWPPTDQLHDPMHWEFVIGKYDYDRWKNGWQELFDTHELAHNNRITHRIQLSNEQDAALAVVDIDTLWINKKTRELNHWTGRVCKMYTLTDEGWKLIAHTGALDYSILK